MAKQIDAVRHPLFAVYHLGPTDTNRLKVRVLELMGIFNTRSAAEKCFREAVLKNQAVYPPVADAKSLKAVFTKLRKQICWRININTLLAFEYMFPYPNEDHAPIVGITRFPCDLDTRLDSTLVVKIKDARVLYKRATPTVDSMKYRRSLFDMDANYAQ